MENESKEPLVLDDEKNLLLEHDADGRQRRGRAPFGRTGGAFSYLDNAEIH